jgi:myo-inositol-1(or 4)-monophosphatase
MSDRALSADTVRQWRESAEAVAVSAGDLAARMRREEVAVRHKGFRDLVTAADLAAQHQIVTTLREQYPDHGFLAEEEDEALSADAPAVWIIDPVDGTSNYSRAIPLYTVSVAVAWHGRVVAGAIWHPAGQELFSAALGQGGHCNGKRLHVSAVSDLAESVIAFDWSRGSRSRQQIISALHPLGDAVHTLRALGSATLALAWVAAGRLDGYFNHRMGAWDIAAGQLIVAEAGGRTTGLAQQPFDLADPHSYTLTSNGALHAALLPCLHQ